jgi:manganese-dependent ADP-ribose/CDP-alcohol diphosphatase
MISKLFTNCITIMLLSLFFLSTGCSMLSAKDNDQHTIGVIADAQYVDVKTKGKRRYSLSKDKLSKCVEHFNKTDVEFVIHLGDFIDRDWKSLDTMSAVYTKLKAPGYHLLGNHDFSVDDNLKKDVPAKLGMPAKYYDFKVKGWRYVVLDGNDISFHAYPKNSEKTKEAAEYYKKNKIKSPKWNGAVGKKQLSWLRKLLDETQKNKEKVIIFCHFPVYPNDAHNLWDAEEVIELIEKFSCVKAYINGHNHHGKYALKEGVHYLTLKGMVDTETTSYAVISVNNETIIVTGYGREKNRNLKIRK